MVDRQSIYSYIFNHDDLIHVPQNERLRLKRLLKQAKETGMSIDELCATRKEFENISSAMSALNIHSMDMPVRSEFQDGQDLTLADIIPDQIYRKQRNRKNINPTSILS